VAYRLMRAMTWVAFGALALGCDGGPGPDVDGPRVGENPPASADQLPPANGDAPPASADDAPPANADAPRSDGGGATPPDESAAEAACDELCSSAAGCYAQQSTGSQLVQAVCDRGCDLDEDERRCESQALSLLDCLADISGLCSADEEDASRCLGPAQAAEACLESDGPPAMGMGCTTAGGCECADDCAECNCVLPGEAGATVCPLVCNM
jgi:hypothetical protein